MKAPFDHLDIRDSAPDSAGYSASQTTIVGKCHRSPQSGWVESCQAARLIYEYYGKDQIVLLMSGGVDSEAMALPFVHLKIPFRVVIGRYQFGLNEPDFKHAVSFCESHSVKYEFIDVELDDFFLNKQLHLQYAYDYGCRSPQLAIHLHLMGQIQGIPILASNPTDIILLPHLAKPILGFPGEPHACYARYLKQHSRVGIPYFFHSTPELVFSFFRTLKFQTELEQMLSFLDQETPASTQAPLTSYLDKIVKYRQAGFQVFARDFKRTGFEEVKEYFQKQYPDTIDPFNTIFRSQMEQLKPYPKIYHRPLSTEFAPQADNLQKLLERLYIDESKNSEY